MKSANKPSTANDDDAGHRSSVASAHRGTHWSIESTSLKALLDLGLNDAEIAAYFRIPTEAVTSLRYRFGLPAAKQ